MEKDCARDQGLDLLETINKRNRHERLAYKNGPLRYLIDKLANM